MKAFRETSEFLNRLRRSVLLSGVLFLSLTAAICGDDDDDDDGGTGPSTDCIDEIDFEANGIDPDDGEAIAFGSSDGGSLSTSDYQFDDGTFYDVWVFHLDEDEVVRIDMESSQVDAYLLLFDENLNPIAQDDDSGAETNAQIVAELDDGCYVVAANSFDAEETGSYTLSIEAD